MEYYNTIIIGAGPAGLSAGLFLKKKKITFIIFDSGKPFLSRNKDCPFEVSHGVGGSGLFSDGKFSYPPAASGLWREWDLGKAESTYHQLEDLFHNCNVQIRSWEEVKAGMLLQDSKIKTYDSEILDYSERKRILQYMCRELENSIITSTTVSSVTKSNENIFLITTDTGTQYSCSTVIIATGKKSPTQLIPNHEKMRHQNIFEMGIRVECPQEYYKPLSYDFADYKHIIQIDDDTQLRTFCSCKNGFVIQSSYDAVHYTYNGDASDVQPYSNVGITIRVNTTISEYAQEMHQAYSCNKTFCIPLREYLKGTFIVGPKTDGQIIRYLPQIIHLEDENCLAKCRIFGPEIERYGNYPDTDSNQSLVSDKNIYVCGDASGKYRGLFAAFFSGLYCANTIDATFMSSIDEKLSQFYISTSETELMPCVFTAQSKVFFYCRDVICEYALSQGYLPINPFRVFDYFLNDRVNRDLIRRGNNNLLQICDELWVFGPISNGVLFEIFSAAKQRKHMRFFSIGTRIQDIQKLELDEISFEPEVHKKRIKKEDLITFIRETNRGYFDRTSYHQLSLFDVY